MLSRAKLHEWAVGAIARFRDLPMYVKGLIVIAIPLAGLLAVAIAFYFVQRSNQEAERWVAHTLEVRSQIQMVHTRVEEAETGVLGHLLTRERSWLTPYSDAQKRLPAVLVGLESMVRDDPSQLDRVHRIQALVYQQIAASSFLWARVPAGVGVHPALVESKQRLDEIRRLLDETRGYEDRLLEARRTHAQSVWSRGYFVIAASLVFIPASAVVAMLLFTMGVVRRVETLDNAAHQLASGLPVEPSLPSHDEIGRLEHSLSDAAALLSQRESELRQSRDQLEARVRERTSELATEVAERKLAEEEVAEANQRLQAVIDASPLAILRVGPDGSVVTWNRAACRIFGWEAREVLGQPLPQIPDEAGQSMHDLLAEAASGEALVNRESRRRRRDGKFIDLRIWTAPLRGSSGAPRGQVVLAADFTEQHQLEEQLTQSQKMEAIGRLASGAAHDFNNVLTIISGYGHMLLDATAGNADLHEAAEEVLKAAERATGLASQLLAFSRKQRSEPRVLDLNVVISEVHRMLGRLLGEDIELRTVLQPGLGAVKADPGQLEQVLMNLVVNARDAMPSGGKLTIETHNANLDESYVRTHAGVTPGPYVMIAVSDTGTGMDAATRAHIFEPFFTTKERGKGTGLGLSTVYGIVKQHGGDIWVYSEPGRGTTFKIYLPQMAAHAVPDSVAADAEAFPSRGETVLVVEDEDGVRKIVCDVLHQRGYRVLDAGSGEKALTLFDQQNGSIDLLVTDIVMPKMNGRDLAEALSLLQPELKVLYLSGYTDHVVFDTGALEGSAAFLQKPFSPNALAQKVRAVLDGRSQTA